MLEYVKEKAGVNMEKRKNFIQITLITFVTYFIMSQMYYTQIYLMEEYYSGTTIFAITDGWAYLMQALGMLVMIALFNKKPQIYGNKVFVSGAMVAMIPLIIVSVLVKSGAVIFAMMLILNFVIGFATAFYFGLMVQYLPQNNRLMSFAIAYALGTIAMWALSKVSANILTSNYIILVDIVLVIFNVYLFMSFENLNSCCNSNEKNASSLTSVMKSNKTLIAIVFLMSVLSVLGSSDNVALTSDEVGLSILDVRALYGIGLITCAWIYAKNKGIGSIVTMASLVLPFVALGMLHVAYASVIVCLITFIALGFYSVYRAGVFMDITSELNLIPVFAVFGLAVSRISDAVTVVAFTYLYPKYFPVSFIVSGIVFIPLIILFFASFIKNGNMIEDADTKKSLFAETHDLTRREEEIAHYISQGKTNGEIAALINLSESTVRFHVANILKKTGLRSRTDVSRAYHKAHK